MVMSPRDRERLRGVEASKGGKTQGRGASMLTSFVTPPEPTGASMEVMSPAPTPLVPLISREAHPPLATPGPAVLALRPKPPQDFRMAEAMNQLLHTAAQRLKMPPPSRQMSLKLDIDLWAYFSMEGVRRGEATHAEARRYIPITRTDLVLEALTWRNDESFRAPHYAGLAIEMDARRAAVGFKKWNGQVPGNVYQALAELHRRVRREVKHSPREITMTSLAEGLLFAWARTNFENPFDPQYPYASESGGEGETLETPQSPES